MPQIDIDFDVYKQLTMLRPSEDVTYNDVLRNLLKLGAPKQSARVMTASGKPWVVSDTSFPEGAEFTADYKGKTYTAVVEDGKLVLSDGHRFSTPSAAAVHITGSNVNGWRFWRCKLPNSSATVLIERLRGKAH